MIDITGAWQWGTDSAFTVPYSIFNPDEDDSLSGLLTRGPLEHPFGVIPVELAEGLLPIEPDGGIGDGAGPIPIDGGDEASDGSDLSGDPIPVEPDGGIGDGAGPIGGPIPVEPDGGIGDGAGPLPDDGDGVIGIPENNIDGGGAGTTGNDFFYATEESDTFVFKGDHGNDTITGFDVHNDVLDLSGTLFDFTDVESLVAHTKESVAEDGTVYGVLIHTGDDNDIYIDGVSIADFAAMTIEF